jgi:dolichyl-phosphate-mannose-protein mannosyltransferase
MTVGATGELGQPARRLERALRAVTGPHLIAGAAILVFIQLASWHVSVPGLFFDEVIQNVSAFAFVKGGLPGESIVLHAGGPQLRLGSHAMNLMTVPYVGDVKNAAFVPVAELFDFTVKSVRYLSIAVAALGMAATYAFGRRLFENSLIPALALVLLAVDPSFIFFSRVDFGPTVFMVLLKAVGGWQLLRWWKTNSRWSLALGAFALGLGVYDKVNFAWVLGAAAIAVAVVAGPAVWRRLNARVLLLGAGAFVAGCLPLIIYNLRTDLASLHSLDTGHQHVAGSYLSNVRDRFGVLSDLLDGSAVADLIRAPFPSHFVELPLLFALAGVAVCVQLLRVRPLTRELRAGAFLVLSTVVLMLIAASAGSINPLRFNGHHVLLAYPFPHLVLALLVVQVGRAASLRARAPRRRAVFASATALLAAAPVTLALISSVGMLRTLDRTGGHGVWSDSVYDLERTVLREHDGQPVVPLDYGFGGNVVGLSQGRLNFRDLTYDLDTERARDVLAGPLRDRRTWFILNSNGTTVYPRPRRRFFQEVGELGGRPRLVHRFRSRDGEPTFEVYSVPDLPNRQRLTASRNP